MTSADRLAEGDRCMATLSAGLRPRHKKAVVTEVLPSGYKVCCDGEEGERRLSEKKVKRLGKPAKPKPPPEPEAPAVDMRGFAEECRQEVADAVRRFAPGAAPDAVLRDQRPPTRLRIPDANVPAVEPGTPSLIRHMVEDPAFAYAVKMEAYSMGVPIPKPKKPSRSAAYLQHVRQHDCCNCGAFGPSDPDHVGPRGVGQKTSDYNCIPLCRACHRRRTDKNVLPEADKNFGGPAFDRSRSDTELIILRAQVQCLREWAEKNEKEIL